MDPASLSCAVSDASNHLGISLLKCLSREPGNVFISPLSLSTALAMLHCASRGETRAEMSKVFGYEEAHLADEDVATAFGYLLSAWDNVPESYVLTCANSIVIDKKFQVKDEYKALLQESFRASLFEADFGSESKKAVEDINNWVKEKTNGMIPQFLDNLPPLTVVVLLNAIYFKGTWLHKFDENSTRSENFYNGGLKQNAKKVQMMHQTARFSYAERESCTVLQLPYVVESIAMMVLLPRSMDGVDELALQLTPQFFNELTKNLRPTKVNVGGLWKEVLRTKVNVSLPKFKFEFSKSMVEVLQSLGMGRAFEDGAELGGMNDSKMLSVSDIIHKAVVEVNEEGSEAAAAVVGKKRCMGVEHIHNFIVDHPFLFTIFDTKSDTIFFLGKIILL